MVATYKDCCVRGCHASYRSNGERGTFLGQCSYEPDGYDFMFIDWDEADSDHLDASIIPKRHLTKISP